MAGLVNAVLVVFALIAGTLGTLAYVAPREGHSASIMSLVAGVGIAGLLLLSIAIWKFLNPRGGRIMAALVVLLCIGRFGMEFAKKPEVFYPNGMMLILSLAVMGVLAGAHFQAMRTSKVTPERG